MHTELKPRTERFNTNMHWFTHNTWFIHARFCLSIIIIKYDKNYTPSVIVFLCFFID